MKDNVSEMKCGVNVQRKVEINKVEEFINDMN